MFYIFNLVGLNKVAYQNSASYVASFYELPSTQNFTFLGYVEVSLFKMNMMRMNMLGYGWSTENKTRSVKYSGRKLSTL